MFVQFFLKRSQLLKQPSKQLKKKRERDERGNLDRLVAFCCDAERGRLLATIAEETIEETLMSHSRVYHTDWL